MSLPPEVIGDVIEDVTSDALRLCLSVCHDFRSLALARLYRRQDIESRIEATKLQLFLDVLVPNSSWPSGWIGVGPYLKEFHFKFSTSHIEGSTILEPTLRTERGLLALFDALHELQFEGHNHGINLFHLHGGTLTWSQLSPGLQDGILRIVKSSPLKTLQIDRCTLPRSFIFNPSISCLRVVNVIFISESELEGTRNNIHVFHWVYRRNDDCRSRRAEFLIR